MQLAPGWRTGANCDRYPRGDGRLGEASTDEKNIQSTLVGCRFEFRLGKPAVAAAKVRESDNRLLFHEIRPSQKRNSDGTWGQLLSLYGCAASGPPHLASGLTIGEAQWLTTELLH
jgi:hypothetical protein